MKTSSLFSLLAATCFAFVLSAKSQIVTYQTQSGYGGSTTTFLDSSSKTQVFTNVSAVTSLTYNFFTGSANSNSTQSDTLLNAKFGEWNGNGGFVTNTTVDFGTITIPASADAAWTNTLSYIDPQTQQQVNNGTYRNASVTFDFTSVISQLVHNEFGYLTDASKTYGFMLTYVSGDTNLALGDNTASTFTNGFVHNTNLGPLSYLLPNDYVFAAISVVPGNQQLVPVPEASTIASIAGAVLVAGLVVARTRQRRQAAAVAPIAA